MLPSGHSGKNCRSKGVSRVLVDASASVDRRTAATTRQAGATPQGCIGQLACRAFRRLWLSRNTYAEMRNPKIAAVGFLEGQFTIVRAVLRSKRPSRRSEDVHPVRLPLLLPRSVVGHSRRSGRQQGFAECPLCLQWRPTLCVATNRRDVSGPDSCTAQIDADAPYTCSRYCCSMR